MVKHFSPSVFKRDSYPECATGYQDIYYLCINVYFVQDIFVLFCFMYYFVNSEVAQRNLKNSNIEIYKVKFNSFILQKLHC